jgi:prolyl-tRNA editing enzyme YbaK/EbsC (Cys-tRNA(Pro) deacylase)
MVAMSDLPESAQRVAEAARLAGLDIRVMEMAQGTRSAEDAARACDCAVDQIVKTLVFLGQSSGKPYILLVSGANHVDEAGIAGTLGEGLSRPDAKTVRALTGFAIGGVAPLGHPEPMPTVIDAHLFEYDLVWAAAGTPRCVFAVAPQALKSATGARIAAF